MASLTEYKRAIKHLLGCHGTFQRFAPVKAEPDEGVPRQGFVAIFDIVGHPRSERCYVWPDVAPGFATLRYVAVLHCDGIDGSEAAFQWARERERTEMERLEQETGLAVSHAG